LKESDVSSLLNAIRDGLFYFIVALFVFGLGIAGWQWFRSSQSGPSISRSNGETGLVESEDLSRWLKHGHGTGHEDTQSVTTVSGENDGAVDLSADSFPADLSNQLSSRMIRGLEVLGLRPLRPNGDPGSVSVNDRHGDTVQLGSLDGRWVLVNFWATWCPPCRREMPFLEALDNRYGDRLSVVAMNLRESREEVRDYVSDHNLSLTVWLDRRGQLARTFNVKSLPVTWIRTPEGRWLGRVLGPRHWDQPPVVDVLGDLVSNGEAKSR
jgi:thiol-disulfide isomerase/thioredoxin